MSQRRALAFYRFTPVAEVEQVQSTLLSAGRDLGLKGTILVAEEGVNGTLVGSVSALEDMARQLVALFGDMPFKWSEIDPDNPGFYRYKVKLKQEIVTMGQPGLDMALTGEHVDADTWNTLLEDPDVLVIDTRNQYEIDIGTFPGAISPHTTNFREFPEWVADHLDADTRPRVAMFCTGGIRCEKASAYLRQQGIDEVYQLDGGILNYLEQVDPQHNAWQGECFVFDQRVSVNADLAQGEYLQCYACRHPVSAEDMASPLYQEGVSCPHCADRNVDRAPFKERQKQVALSEARGERHIGGGS